MMESPLARRRRELDEERAALANRDPGDETPEESAPARSGRAMVSDVPEEPVERAMTSQGAGARPERPL